MIGPHSGAKSTVVAVVLIATLGIASVPVAADVTGHPVVSLTAADNRISPGQATTVGLTVLNAGHVDESSAGNPGAERRVTTARGLTLEMRTGDAPVEVRTGTVAVGSVPEGAVGPIPFGIVVDEDAEPGTYEVPVRVTYVYTSSITEDNGTEFHHEETVSRTMRVDVRVVEGARFEIVDATTDAPIGGGGTLSLAIENVGTGTAGEASVRVRAPGGDLLFGSGAATEAFAGTWKPGETRRFEFDAEIRPGTARRRLPIETTVSFENEDGVPVKKTAVGGVTPAGEGQFSVESVRSTAAIGAQDSLRVTIHNAGEHTVRDATVAFRSSNAALTFGGAPTARTFVGSWDPGESRTLVVETGFGPTAVNRSYAVEATVSYVRDDRTIRARPLTFGVRPAPDQAFDLEDVNATLRVGDEGQLTGRVRNLGPGAVENAVVVLEPPASVTNAEPEYALGTLGPNETGRFAYDLEVSSSARSGPRQFTVRVRYDTPGETGTSVEKASTRLSDPLYARESIGPRQAVFTVRPVRADVEAGKSARLVLEVTNAGDEPVSDVSAKLFTDDPISVTDDEAFVDSLAPGERTKLVFQVGAGGGALAKTYPVSMDFQYTEPDGDTRLSDTHRLPVTVTKTEGGLLPFVQGWGWPPLAAGAAGLGLVGLVLGRRLG